MCIQVSCYATVKLDRSPSEVILTNSTIHPIAFRESQHPDIDRELDVLM